MHLFLKKLFVFIAGSSLGVLLFFGAYHGVPVLFAAPQQSEGGFSSNALIALNGDGSGEPGAGPASADALATASCSKSFPAFADQERTKFIEFMNAHFKNNAPNSYLLPVAMDKLKDYKAMLRKKANSFYTDVSKSQSDVLDELNACGKLLQTQMDIADGVFQSHVQDTAYSKRSTALAEKLRSINGKLKSLNDLFGELDGYFTSFSNKLPGYTQACITK